MKILIFSESDDAKKLMETERGKDNLASLRNPQYFDDSSAQMEKADKVYCESDAIESAYKAIDIQVERLDKPKPKPKRKAKK